MENIQATLPPSVIKRVVKRRGFNTTIIGAYVHDDKLFVMYNGLSEFIFTSEGFPPIVWESIINNGLRIEYYKEGNGYDVGLLSNEHNIHDHIYNALDKRSHYGVFKQSY